MKEAIFLRLLGEGDKGAGLARALDALRDGAEANGIVYRVDPTAFREVPGTPFAYWVSDRVRRLFKDLPPFEADGRTVRQGLATADDFRFIRAWWEVPADRILDGGRGPSWREDLGAFQAWCRQRTHEGKRWAPLAKGGEYSPYYADIHLVVNWEREGAEMKAWADPLYGNSGWSRIIKSTEYYFRPGLTWPERTTSGYCPQAMPAGVVFSVTGQAMLPDDGSLLPALLSAHSTRVYEYLEELMIGLGEESVSGSAARHYTGGTIKRLPYPESFLLENGNDLGESARKITHARRLEQAEDEACWFFSPEPLAAPSLRRSATERQEARLREWTLHLVRSSETETAVRCHFGFSTAEIAEMASVVGPHPVADLPEREPQEMRDEVADALGKSLDLLIDEAVENGLVSRSITKKSFFVSRFHELLAQRLGCSAISVVEAHRQAARLPLGELDENGRRLVSTLVGVAFGRWDVRMLLDPALAPKLPDLFDPLPICPPATLVGPDGLPARSGIIASEEWLLARPDANTLPPDGSVKNPAIPDSEYPLRISWDGILVDDPGFNGTQPHRDDIVRRVREVLDLLWKDKAHAIEQEACEILGVKDIRDYFRRPAGFFQDHLKRYSKSRRKAPIYWPLSTASGSYTIWIYYHRLTDQTLYAAVNKYLEPKIAEVERAISRIEKDLDGASGRQATQLRDRLNEGRTLASELRDLRQELLRIAALPYKPNLNDGVIINAAPFHKLFRLRSWAKDTEKVWKKLEKGDYDWAHLAYTLWPDRVKEVCRKDRSIAIAHGLEELCEVSPPQRKARASKKGRVRRSKS